MQTRRIAIILSLLAAGSTAGANATESFIPASTARLGDNLATFEPSPETPILRFSEAREVMVAIEDSNGAKALTADLDRPVSTATGQLDDDGVFDLVVGYAADRGGAVVVYRGNPDFLYSRLTKERLFHETGIEIPAFLDPALLIPLPVTPDFLAVGDFNGDGLRDLVAACRGDDRLALVAGTADQKLSGGATTITLPGRLTALVSGEVNRRNGLEDIVVGVSGPAGAEILVFEGPNGALRAEPEAIPMAAEVTALGIGQLTGDDNRDIAAAAGDHVVVIAGRDRKLSLSAAVRASVPPPAVATCATGSAIAGLALGNFTGDARDEIAVLSADGLVTIVNQRSGDGPVSPVSVGSKRGGSGLVIFSARVSGLRYDDLLIADDDRGTIEFLTHNPLPGKADDEPAWHELGAVNAVSSLGPALSGQLDFDALDDLVIVTPGGQGPAVMARKTLATYVVNATDSVSDHSCDSTHCSLPDAQWAAESNPGVDTISFAVGFSQIQLVGSVYVDFNEAVVIDGTQGVPPLTYQTEIDGSGLTVSSILTLKGPSTTVESMILGGHPSSSCIRFVGADNSVLTGSRIGVGRSGVADVGCAGSGVEISPGSSITIGGTTSLAGNVIGWNSGSGISVVGSPSALWETSSNSLLRNSIGTDSSHMSTLGNTDGIRLYNAVSTHVGSNTIGGSASSGVLLDHAYETLVDGNFIGVNSGGDPLSNTQGITGYYSQTTTIGGTATAARNVISGQLAYGVDFSYGMSGVYFQGNYVGTDPSGTYAVPNVHGIRTLNDAEATIGGVATGAGNVISGNSFEGIQAFASGSTTVQGNLIGTTAGGSAALPNGRNGILIFHGLVGGGDPDAGNVISGNGNDGVQFRTSSTGVLVEGNFIGTDAGGTMNLGNGDNGIRATSDADDFTNVIGGTGAGAGNTIAFNSGDGIYISSGNAGIRGNPVFSNGGLGISLSSGGGVTANDAGDADSGPNLHQNFPVITAVVVDATSSTISGTLNSSASGTYDIDFFQSTACDASGYGEGAVYVGTGTISTDANGDATFNSVVGTAVPAGSFITATATATTGDGANTTSEFSACFQVSTATDLIFSDGFESGDTTDWIP